MIDEEFLRGLFASEGPITIRRMFGGCGIYLDGRIVAIAMRDGSILLKGDEKTAAHFMAAGAERWHYARPGRTEVAMPYWALPSEALDDPDAMAIWARRAREAAERADKPRKPKRGKPVQSPVPISMKAGTSAPKPTGDGESS